MGHIESFYKAFCNVNMYIFLWGTLERSFVTEKQFYPCTTRNNEAFRLCRNLNNWATSWENLFMQYANNKGADQPVHMRSLIIAFVVRCLDSIILLLPTAEISRVVSLCSWADSYESYWSQTLKAGFLVPWHNSGNLFPVSLTDSVGGILI